MIGRIFPRVTLNMPLDISPGSPSLIALILVSDQLVNKMCYRKHEVEAHSNSFGLVLLQQSLRAFPHRGGRRELRFQISGHCGYRGN